MKAKEVSVKTKEELMLCLAFSTQAQNRTAQQWKPLLQYRDAGETFHTDRCWLTSIDAGRGKLIIKIKPHMLQAVGASNIMQETVSPRITDFDDATRQEIKDIAKSLINKGVFAYGKHKIELKVLETFNTPTEVYLWGEIQ